MSTLFEALTQTTLRWLLVIGRKRGLHYSSSILKADLVRTLAEVCAEPAGLQMAVDELSPVANSLLRRVIAAGGNVRLSHLLPRGLDTPAVREALRARPEHIAADAVPFAAELRKLRSLGLVFYHAATDEVFVPTGLREDLTIGRVGGPPGLAGSAELALWRQWNTIEVAAGSICAALVQGRSEKSLFLGAMLHPSRTVGRDGRNRRKRPSQRVIHSLLWGGRREKWPFCGRDSHARNGCPKRCPDE